VYADEIHDFLPRKSSADPKAMFLDEEAGTLFSVHKLAAANTATELRKSAIMHQWWDYMADLMEVNPDNSPVRAPFKAVFHQD
jgi:L-rhamnose mutarotase